jgi:branched-chain amino acid transport system ATP-binding protein
VASVLKAEHLLELRDRTVRSLAYGQQRLLEIVLALASQPRVLLLDEPTAGLGRNAATGIMDRVANLPESVTVILIEHDLDVAFRVSQTATVMARGEIVAHGTLDEIRRNPMVQELYLGAAK